MLRSVLPQRSAILGMITGRIIQIILKGPGNLLKKSRSQTDKRLPQAVEQSKQEADRSPPSISSGAGPPAPVSFRVRFF